ncbi:protein-glutamine gamma-glutamyltransferase E isoform X2 [Dasypus novemcinctus]|uniref:protein-glutamine gamma-glutamyltransferase E isoform X2 n=1 Tax=Dasypus novemcinctus TaxID=9361 RepID=UPI00265DFB68|nr:protein-glutamine gamma-glutamyltransferase E isoform X2 [Dasypus novemcinctus]XP_058142794.1 protein-glutamine gamma-glutamyltransferase E isoform X2 [Dasypus novemcinctus]
MIWASISHLQKEEVGQNDLGTLFWLGNSESVNVDWQMNSNQQAHHTDKFNTRELIVRRGRGFTIIMNMKGNPISKESLVFTASTGPSPSESARTKAVFPLSSGRSGDGWSAVLQNREDSSLTITISTPANAPIGQYLLGVKSSQGNDFSANLGTFILLFNPWLQADSVFMNNHAEREEYIQQDFGIIYVGSVNRISMVGWNFGQFEEGILKICLLILDKSLNFRRDPAMDVARRSDPKYVGRVLSAMINGNDDNGVLSGNWSGDYTGGRDPRNWNGSVEILKEWKNSDFRPVRFGQCWVFAGTLNTVLRCFGIPSRVVTNFNSAHDTDRNLSVDVYYDPMGNPLDRGSDSVWNFHVWNEGWFVRTDLGPSFNGWQVLDATPQERSQGVFQCGPASVFAIREGDVDLLFDTPFAFSEVNADRIIWIYDKSTDSQKQNSSDSNSVGKYISTKAVGSYSRMDITEKYKYPEGSSQERHVFEKALGKLKPSREFGPTSAGTLVADEQEPSISAKFKINGILQVGKEVNLVLILKNLTSDMKMVTVHMTAWTIVYNGTLVHEVWKDSSIKIALDPEEETQYPVKIPYAQYAKYLTADNMIRTTALCEVSDEGEVLVERDIILDNPTLTLEVLNEARVRQPVNVQMLFSNPLDEPVKDCVLMVEGSGLLRGSLKIDVPSLRPKERSRVRFELLPTRSGTKQLLADFSCNKFPAIKAMLSIDVAE